MDTAFITRTLKASLLLTALSYLLFSYYKGGSWALGFCLGALWTAASLFLLRELVIRFITTEERPFSALLILGLLKFPLLKRGPDESVLVCRASGQRSPW